MILVLSFSFAANRFLTGNHYWLLQSGESCDDIVEIFNGRFTLEQLKVLCECLVSTNFLSSRFSGMCFLLLDIQGIQKLV